MEQTANGNASANTDIATLHPENVTVSLGTPEASVIKFALTVVLESTATAPCNCQNGGVCNSTDGSCRCPPGVTGRRCEKECPPGTYGPGCSSNCSCSHGHCDSKTGACLCSPGFRGSRCDKECSNGAYGPGCSLKCECQNNASCDSVTGTCKCKPGFTGPTCSKGVRPVVSEP
ncbi:hypothetical protein MRX96_028576 [Rhipicephalus microplus]